MILNKECLQCGKGFNNTRNDGYTLCPKQFNFRKFCSNLCRTNSRRSKNKFIVKDSIIEILFRGRIIILDKEMSDLLKYKWSIDGYGYAVARNYESHEKISMHRFIMGKKHGFVIDHVNRNRLDNRLKNLRFVTPSENCFNRGGENVGIYFRKNNPKHYKRWHASIKIKGQKIHLGSFKTKEEALNIRRKAEVKYFPGIKTAN